MQVFAHPVVYQRDYLMSSSCRHKKKVHYYAIPTVTKSQQVCHQPRPLAVNMALPAFCCSSVATTGQTDGRTDGPPTVS